VMADVFGADVYQLQVGNSAALGAALRALHGGTAAEGRAIPWDEVVKDFAEPVSASRLHPDPSRHTLYRDLIDIYAACEVHALGRGPDPSARLAAFRSRSKE